MDAGWATVIGALIVAVTSIAALIQGSLSSRKQLSAAKDEAAQLRLDAAEAERRRQDEAAQAKRDAAEAERRGIWKERFDQRLTLGMDLYTNPDPMIREKGRSILERMLTWSDDELPPEDKVLVQTIIEPIQDRAEAVLRRQLERELAEYHQDEDHPDVDDGSGSDANPEPDDVTEEDDE